MHSFWETKKLGEKEILATEYSRDAPVIQIWRFRLEGNRIYWTVEMQANSMIKLEREQANIMLSGAYRTWSTSESAGYFPEGFNTDYGGDWQSLSTLEPRPDKRITALGDNVHLPTVSFYCTYPRNTMRGAIINSDDQFKGRVLQYVLKHGPLHFIAWCRYTYFQGYFLIEE